MKKILTTFLPLIVAATLVTLGYNACRAIDPPSVLPSPPAALDAPTPSLMPTVVTSAPSFGWRDVPTRSSSNAKPTDHDQRLSLQSASRVASPASAPTGAALPSFLDGVRLGALALKRNPDIATLDELARIALAVWQQEQAARASQQQQGGAR